MDVIADAHRFGVRGLAFADQQIEHDGLVICSHARQRARLAPDQQANGPSVQRITLSAVPGRPSTGRGPTRVDLEHRLAAGDQTLRQTAPIAPGTLDTPLTRATQADCPV